MRRRTRDRGATSVEYALLGALIAVVIAGATAALGQLTLDLFSRVNFP